MSDCLFCKIIAREVPSDVIYEDEHAFAFLDIHPNGKGHTLVIPKKHAVLFSDMSEEDVAPFAQSLHKVAKALEKYKEGLSIVQRNGKAAGQEIMHVHFHLIPRSVGDGVKIEPWDGTYDNKGRWDLKAVAEELRALF